MNDDKEKKVDDLVADPISQSSDSLSLKPALMAEFGSWSSSASVESVTSGWCNNNNNNPYLYASISNPEEGSEEGHEHSTVGHSHQCEHLASSKYSLLWCHFIIIDFTFCRSASHSATHCRDLIQRKRRRLKRWRRSSKHNVIHHRLLSPSAVQPKLQEGGV